MSGSGMESEAARPRTSGAAAAANGQHKSSERSSYFQMPLHYPRYTQSDYETMPEWKVDCLLKEYGLPVTGDVEQKRKFAIGAFIWPH